MSHRKERLERELAQFMRQYQRTSRRRGLDPNDRKYDHDLEKAVKRMDPQDLDELLHGDGDDDE